MCEKAVRILRYYVAISREKRNADRTFTRAKDFMTAFNVRNYNNLTDDDLLEKAKEFYPFFLDLCHRIGLLNAASQPPFTILLTLLKRAFPGRESTIANALLAGTGTITSAEQGYRIITLAETARNDRCSREFFASEPFQPFLWETMLPDTSVFKKEFRTFLDDFGHRAVYETDAANPRWREDPSYLFDCVRKIMDTADLASIRRHQEDEREKALKEVESTVSWPMRIVIRRCAKAAVKGLELRERGKSELIRSAGGTRSNGLEIGRRFVDRSLLEQPEDIFHLSWQEIVAILRKTWGGDGLRALVEDRKKERLAYLAMNPPDLIIDDVPQYARANVSTNGHVFTGIGVAAGTASGKACVLLHPEDGTKLSQGDILVAPSTDPGWSPLFLRAGGIVMETGGALSHGAIVAREYGIPAVVNIPGITRIIKDGQKVSVSGDEGKVYLR